MRLARAVLLSAPLLCFACDEGSPATEDGTDTDGRGPLGKADGHGSCQPTDCGGQASSGTCWCDDQCAGFGDCCSNRASVCDPSSPVLPEPVEAVSGAWTFADVYGVANVDADGGTAAADWAVALFGADDDPSQLVLPAAVLAVLEPGDEVRMNLSGNTQAVRLWHRGQPVLGQSAPGSYAFQPVGGDEGFSVEFGDYNAAAVLQIQHVRGGQVLATDSVQLRSSPLTLNHHLQPAERVWAVRVDEPGYDNGAMIATYQNVLGSKFTAIPGPLYGNDVWIQDEFEFATTVGEQGQRLDIIIDSIRDRGLDDYAEDALVGPGVIAETWGNPANATSYDAFGNLENSPPVVVDGVEFPFGRIYYGGRGSAGLTGALRNALAAQQLQAPFELDTTWLCVGHVDEFSSFVPDPSSARGFKLLLADVRAAIDLLEELPPSMQLPRYAADHGYASVGQILGDPALMALNEDIQEVHLDTIRQQFETNLGLTDADIIEVPSLFERVSGCGAGALIPGMVNLIVADVGGETHLFVPDPFFRGNLGNQSEDPVIEEFTGLMPDGLSLHFVDNWDVYHLGIGEVHCGTNVQRTPTDQWWTSGLHLLGGN